MISNTEFRLHTGCTEASFLDLHLVSLCLPSIFFPLTNQPIAMLRKLPNYWNWLFLNPIPLYDELQKLYIKWKIKYNCLFLNMKTMLITILQINIHNYSNYNLTITHWYLLL